MDLLALTQSPLIIAIVGALGLAGGSFLTARIQKRGTVENLLIDQLQEQVAAADRRTEAVEKRERAQRRRERMLDDYIAQLRQHISDGNPPPPPPWPFGLLSEVDQDEPSRT